MTTKVYGVGPKPARILILGERPGKKEMESGKPFVGQTGRELDRRLWDCRLDRATIYLDNLVKDRVEGKDKPPSPEEIHRDEPDLWAVLDEVRPETIVTMGLHSTRYFLGEEATLERCHAIPRTMKFTYSCGLKHIQCTVFPMYHIAAGFHAPTLQPMIEYDWEQFKLFLTHGAGLFPEPVDAWADSVQYSLASTTEFDLLLDTLRERPLLAPGVDTEGLSGDPWGLSISICPGTALVLKKWHHPDEWFERLNEALQDRCVVLHNSLHDLQILRELGIYINDFLDTMVLAYLLQVEPQGLKPLSYRHSGMEMSDYLDVVAPYAQELYRAFIALAASNSTVLQLPTAKRKMSLDKRLKKMLKDASKGEVDLKKRWDALDDDQKAFIEAAVGESFPVAGLKHVPDEVAVPYSARDADATFRLLPALEPRVSALGLNDISVLDHSVLPMVDRMQQVGMMVDQEYFRGLGTVLEQEMALLTHTLQSNGHGLMFRPDYNPASSDQLAKVLFEDFGLNPIKLTKGKKRPAVDSKVLEELLITYQDRPEVVRFITDQQDFTERLKLKGTYVDNLEKFTASDGRIHPSLRTTRVVSGRLSSHDPNLLAIPVRTGLGRLIRGGFVAPRGRQLGSWDLDQIEMRVLAHESADPAMVEVLSDPKRHIHKETTHRIYGIPVAEVDKNSTEYMMSKNISFGIMYGITADGLRAQMAQRGQHRTKEQCQEMIDAYLNIAYPGVKDYMDKCRCDAIRQGYVKTIMGRLRYIPGIKSSIQAVRSEAERAAGNHPIQGGASDIVKLWMRQLWPKIRHIGVEPLLQVHDELILEFDEGEFELVDYLVKTALWEGVEPLRLRVPIRCGGKAAQDWGGLK